MFFKTTEEVDHKAIHTTFQELTCNTKLHPEERSGLQRVRHNIDDYTYRCRSNLLVIIYIDKHRADICAGKKENKLKITIDKKGEVEYKWLERTWSKLLIDKSLPVLVVPFKILGFIEDKLPSFAVRVVNYFMSFCQTSGN